MSDCDHSVRALDFQSAEDALTARKPGEPRIMQTCCVLCGERFPTMISAPATPSLAGHSDVGTASMMGSAFDRALREREIRADRFLERQLREAKVIRVATDKLPVPRSKT